jgi:hypothetical protein
MGRGCVSRSCALHARPRTPPEFGARRAAARVREGAESSPQTPLRLLPISAGIREPTLNLEVRDQSHRRIGRFDLVYVDERAIVEYDGDQHRTTDEQTS